MTPERWKRTEELYHAARARPPGERAAFLVEACPDDDALRRDVESLLNEPVSDGGLLDGPALVMPAHMVTDLGPAAMTGRILDVRAARAPLCGRIRRSADIRYRRV